MTTERDCKHGQLARSCNVCELEAEVARQAAEIERLNNCLRLEQNRMERIGTHANDCYKWGPAHWECAMREIERMKSEHAEVLAQYRVMLEGKKALLRQALEALLPFKSTTLRWHQPVDAAIAAIKTYFGGKQ